MGQTRFRDHTDDMPIVGYGWGALMYERTMVAMRDFNRGGGLS